AHLEIGVVVCHEENWRRQNLGVEVGDEAADSNVWIGEQWRDISMRGSAAKHMGLEGAITEHAFERRDDGRCERVEAARVSRGREAADAPDDLQRRGLLRRIATS